MVHRLITICHKLRNKHQITIWLQEVASLGSISPAGRSLSQSHTQRLPKASLFPGLQLVPEMPLPQQFSISLPTVSPIFNQFLWVYRLQHEYPLIYRKYLFIIDCISHLSFWTCAISLKMIFFLVPSICLKIS